MAKYDERGREVPDSTPVAIPVRFRMRPGEVERLKDIIRGLMSEEAGRGERETFEEANDFEVEGEDEAPAGPYEVMADDEQFSQYARDASLDDDGKREYIRKRFKRKEKEHGRESGDEGVERNREGDFATRADDVRGKSSSSEREGDK